MAGVVNVPLYMNPASQDQQAQAMQMIRAQLLAQQAGQAGQMPDDNEMAGNVVVKHSPLEYLSRSISQNMGNIATLKAAKMQMALMGQNMGSGATGGNPALTGGAGSGGITPQTLRQAALYDQLYGQGAGKAYLDSLQPTPDMKNAAASNVATPLDYNKQSAINTANANASVKPTTYTTPDGITHQTTEAALAGMVGDGGLPSPKLPLGAVNNVLGGMGNPDVAPSAQTPSNVPPAIPNGAAIPPVQPVSQGSLTPPTGFAQANGSVPSQGGAMAPVAGFKDPITPVAQSASQVPFSQMVAQSAPNISGGMQVQSPAQAGGALEAQKNYQGYLQNLNKTVSEFQSQLPIINAQEDFMRLFRPGAGATHLAQAASIAQSLGADQDTVASISRGDPGAVQAFDALASQHAMKQAVTLMGQGSTNGGSGGRMSQAIFEKFREDLSNPDKQANAIRAINALTRQQADLAFKEQQAAYADKGDPLTFQERYAAQQQKQLMDGRAQDPAQAIQQGAVQKENTQSSDIPAGGQVIGTSGGKRVIKMPNGQTLLEQ